MKFWFFIIAMLIGYSAYCGTENSRSDSISAYKKAQLELFQEATAIIQRDYIFRDSLNLPAEFARMRQEYIKAADSISYRIPINKFFEKLEDRHSGIYKPEPSSYTTIYEEPKMATGHMADSIAYISITSYWALNSKMQQAYADSLQQIIAQLASAKPKGWIIDLRKNEGGNGIIMMAGIGPLLGNGLFGYFKNVDGELIAQSYYRGVIRYNKRVVFKLKHPIDTITYPNIALIIGPNTASAAEWMAISFKGKPNNLLIGEPTMGVSTSPTSYILKDGAIFSLATTLELDRNRKPYGKKIYPDILITDGERDGKDTAIDAAIEWLSKRK